MITHQRINNSIQKKKQLLMKTTVIMYLTQSMLLFYQTYKNLQNKVTARFDSVIDHNIGLLNGNLSAGSSYIKLPKQLRHSRTGFIYIHNTDYNKYFKWCLVYIHPPNFDTARKSSIEKLLLIGEKGNMFLWIDRERKHFSCCCL